MDKECFFDDFTESDIRNLEATLEIYTEQECKKLDQLVIDEYKFSDDFEKRINKIFRDEKHD